jgi:hypothetical protein
MRNQLTAVVIAALVACACSSAFAYGPTHIELAEDPTQLPDGNWEYVYDLYGDESAWVVNCALSGFDASQIVNQWPVEFGGRQGTLVQHWDWLAANVSATPYLADYYGSTSTDDISWALHSQPWAVENTWHAPTDYVLGAPEFLLSGGLWTFAGVIAEDGQRLQFDNKVADGTLATGLIHTFRIVHPYAPGPIDWSVWSYLEECQGSGTVLGPVVPEPATMGLLGLGGPALLRRRKK